MPILNLETELVEAIDPQDLTSLRTLYQREYQQLPFQKIDSNTFSMRF